MTRTSTPGSGMTLFPNADRDHRRFLFALAAFMFAGLILIAINSNTGGPPMASILHHACTCIYEETPTPYQEFSASRLSVKVLQVEIVIAGYKAHFGVIDRNNAWHRYVTEFDSKYDLLRRWRRQCSERAHYKRSHIREALTETMLRQRSLWGETR